MLQCLGKEVGVVLLYAALPQADFERLLRALFTLQARAVFAAAVAADVTARANSRLGRAIARISRLTQAMQSA
jgi:hypothetical protein